MPETVAQALAQPGLVWVMAAAYVAGVVRGFAGFGTAMVFLPVASQVLPPITAIVVLLVMDLIGPLPAMPRALRDGHPSDLMRLTAGALVALPAGIAILLAVDPNDFKLAVSLVTLVLLALLLSGLRYRGPMTPPVIYGTGAAAGFMGGAVALPGPPVVLLYMASPLPAHVVRANSTMFLLAYDVMMAVGLMMSGRFTWAAAVLGLLVMLPYLAGNLTGGWIFRPGGEKIYRAVAFAIITASALSGLWSVLGT